MEAAGQALVEIGSAIATSATTAILDFTSSYTKVEDKEKEGTVALPKEQKNNNAIFYGADTLGGQWKTVTTAMSYDEAKMWVTTSSLGGAYGKNSSWGLYTQYASDASTMAWDLGSGIPIFHSATSGQYSHYHVNNYMLFNKHKHFHIWYGDLG